MSNSSERVPFIAGNWKMNFTLDKVKPFLEELSDSLPADSDNVETAIAASPLFLQSLLDYVKEHDLPLKIGAENCFYKSEGAYTGEVSPKALAEMGTQYVIVGHSERRKYFHEDDQMINKKVRAVLRNGMSPIVCCDETLGRSIDGERDHWVVNQLIAALKNVPVKDASKIVVAYEPSWAIGTGNSASADEAEEGCYLFRRTLASIYSEDVANKIRILYGGSVDPSNINELMKQPDIDGTLAGGCSLSVKRFSKLINYQK